MRGLLHWRGPGEKPLRGRVPAPFGCGESSRTATGRPWSSSRCRPTGSVGISPTLCVRVRPSGATEISRSCDGGIIPKWYSPAAESQIRAATAQLRL